MLCFYSQEWVSCLVALSLGWGATAFDRVFDCLKWCTAISNQQRIFGLKFCAVSCVSAECVTMMSYQECLATYVRKIWNIFIALARVSRTDICCSSHPFLLRDGVCLLFCRPEGLQDISQPFQSDSYMESNASDHYMNSGIHGVHSLSLQSMYISSNPHVTPEWAYQ